MSSRTTTNAMSLYNIKNYHMMSNFGSSSTRHPSFVAAGAARRTAENTITSAGAGASITSSNSSNSSCNHDVSSVRSTNTTTSSQELSSAAVANNRVPPAPAVADDLDEDANQGANDLLMTAATALASFSSSQILVRESTPRSRNHDGGPHQLFPITTDSTSTTPRTKTRTGGGTRNVRLQQQHQEYPSSTSTNTGDDSSPAPPPLQQQLPLLLSSSRHHDHDATRPTNHAAYELLDGGWQEHDYGRGSHHRRGVADDFAIITEHLPNKAQSKQKAKRFPVKVSRFFRWMQRTRVTWCLFLFITFVPDVGANKIMYF